MSLIRSIKGFRSSSTSKKTDTGVFSAAVLSASALLLLAFPFPGHAGPDADYYFHIGDWNRAAAAYRDLVDEQPTADNLRRLAESYYRLGNANEAENALARLGSDRLSEKILALLVKAEKGEFDAAREGLDRLLREDKDQGGLLTALGTVELRRGDLARALRHFEEAVEKNPGDFWAWFYTGTIYETWENPDMAIKAYKRALSINADFAQAVNNLGYCYKEMRFYAYAIEQYWRAIELIPDKADYYYNIGNAFTMENDIDAAYAAYQKAIELEPTFAKAHYNLGRTYVRKGMLKEAIKSFKRYLKYGTTPVFRYVASERAVQEEIESLELDLRNNTQ